MKTVCSFCNAVIREGETPDDPVSHGVCKSCYQNIFAKHRFNIRKFLDLLEAPVFLMDRDVNVVAANTSTLTIAGKPLSQVKGNLYGKVFECVNSMIPHGCGRTKFCPDCAIRSSVNETYKTGTRIERKPALIHRNLSSGIEPVRLFVTTQKDGEIVLLRLEAV